MGGLITNGTDSQETEGSRVSSTYSNIHICIAVMVIATVLRSAILLRLAVIADRPSFS